MKGISRVLHAGSLFFLSVWPLSPALADVSPGDVLDKTNWQKAQGLLPDPVLNWVRAGDFILEIGELNYDPSDYFPAFAKEARKKNLGKYQIGPNDSIVETATGQPPEHILGLPFAQIDREDPGLSVKIMQNNHYMQYLPGNLRFPYQSILLNRRGFEREIESVWHQIAMDGYPGAFGIPNPSGIEKYAIAVVLKPYDVAGTAIMLWRYLDPVKQDMTFGYVPAIRRVRRMSPANRSDAMFGTDMTVDDANGYDGKVSAFEWKFLRGKTPCWRFWTKIRSGSSRTSRANGTPPKKSNLWCMDIRSKAGRAQLGPRRISCGSRGPSMFWK